MRRVFYAGCTTIFHSFFMSNELAALSHDDRLYAVAGAVAHFQLAMMMDMNQAAKAVRDEEINA